MSVLDVSRETMDRLQNYVDLLLKWTPRINLISKSSKDHIWDRHIADSLQVAQTTGPVDHWLDLGSGGGLPALVVAIAAKEQWPDTRFTLIESDQRKCAFLRTVIRELDLSATVITNRIEHAEAQSADVVSARALANLSELLSLAHRHAAPSGIMLFQKGSGWKKEVQEAQEGWTFKFDAISSQTQAEAVILKIEGVSRD